MNEWISVEDRLPEGECIAFGFQGEKLIGYITPDSSFAGEYRCDSEGEYLTNVTHWMQPEPPKEK